MSDVPDLGAIRFRQHRDAGAALNATFVFIRHNARELTTSYLAVVAPVLLASGLSSALWLSQVGDQVMNPSADDPFGMFNWTYAGSLVFGLVGGALMQATAAAYVRLYREGQAGSITVSVLWEEARGLIVPYIGLSVVLILVLMLSAVIVIIPCLGALAWLAFALWLLPVYAVAISARALEAPSVAQAWMRARDLIKGSLGFALGTMFLAFMVLMVLYVALSAVLGGLVGAASLSSPDVGSAMFGLGLVFAPLQVLVGAAYLVPLIAGFFVHGRLVDDLEGTSLEDDLDTLASGVEERSAARPPVSTPPPAPEAPTDDPDAPPPSGGFRGGGFG